MTYFYPDSLKFQPKTNFGLINRYSNRYSLVPSFFEFTIALEIIVRQACYPMNWLQTTPLPDQLYTRTMYTAREHIIIIIIIFVVIHNNAQYVIL